jgi:hypothetical protein
VNEQVIRLIAGSSLLEEVGMKVGSYLMLGNDRCRFRGVVRHELKIMPDYDINTGSKVFISREQADHILEVCRLKGEKASTPVWSNLFVRPLPGKIEPVISAVMAKAPPHTVVITTL